MNTINDGWPVYPFQGSQTDASDAFCGTYVAEKGMSVRDFFAGQALAGMLADPNEAPKDGQPLREWRDITAAACYQLADAMIQQRSKNNA